VKILQVHNKYQQHGGEDGVLLAERLLLESRGCQLSQFVRANDGISSIVSRLQAGLRVVSSKSSQKELGDVLSVSEVTVAHVHNFFPILTPSIYNACIEKKVPIVQTLHNYRTVCPGALLMRDGHICEKCLTSSPYYAVLHGCYRNSRFGSLAVARMVDYHRKHNTWGTKVDRFIALTEFGKKKFVEAGFPEHKIAVKPNFYSGKGVEHGVNAIQRRSGALFVGRISSEKGIRTLIKAWGQASAPLRIVGGGPVLEDAQSCGIESLSCLGPLDSDQVSDEMKKASFLIMPSECYEGFPIVLAEAFAHGIPVIASRLGAMAEIVEDGVTGLHFEPGNAEDLAAKVRWMSEHPDECRQMGYNARREFEAKYTPERNYEMLMKIYQEAIDEKKKSR
jgi:glycosyltransferase involved in cell wall biosynthesis